MVTVRTYEIEPLTALAGFLRRNGVEAYVRLYDDDQSDAAVRRSLTALLSH